MEKRKFFTAKYDLIFKNALCTENNKDLLCWFLEKTLQVKIKRITLKVPELSKKSIFIKNKTLDVLVETEEEIINLEINSGIYASLPRRNMAYLCSKYATDSQIGDSYLKMKNYIQLNFTWGLKKEYPKKAVYELEDEKTKRKFVDNFHIIEFNMDKLIEEWYNNADEVAEYKHIIMLGLEQEELEKISIGDQMMERFKNNVEELNKDEDVFVFLTEDEMEKKLENTLIDEAKMKGREVGKKEQNKEIALSMMQDGMSTDKISKYTGLSKKQIENLK